MKRYKYAGIALPLLVAIFILASAKNAQAGAWTIKKGKIWSLYQIRWAYAKDAFNEEGKKKGIAGDRDARKWQFSMQPKLEYGVADWLNALCYLEYKEAHYKEYNRPSELGTFCHKHYGVDGVQTGAKMRVIEDPVVLTLQPKAFIYPGYGIDHGDDPSHSNYPPLGYGDDAFEMRVLTGKTFLFPLTRRLAFPVYWKLESGYRWRTRHVCNDIPFYTCFGLWPREWLLLNTEIDAYKCHAGTGSKKESCGIWRAGMIWQVFGNSTLRQGAQMFNIQFQYGMTVWGKNTTAYDEYLLSIHTHF
jgi:hypothetical protein